MFYEIFLNICVKFYMKIARFNFKGSFIMQMKLLLKKMIKSLSVSEITNICD